MSKVDFSKEIYERYFGIALPPVIITLSDSTEYIGKLTGFFRGEKEFSEPYILLWRFVSEPELKEIEFLPYPNQDVGCLIRQSDIDAIRFK